MIKFTHSEDVFSPSMSLEYNVYYHICVLIELRNPLL